MYIAKGVSIVRSKPLNVHNPRTEKQQVQRARMKTLVRLVSGFGPALSVGYPPATGLVSPNNRFVQDNMAAVTVDDDFKVSVDYSKIVCTAARRLKTPKVAVSYDTEGKRFVFTQGVQEQTPTCHPADVAWVVVYEKVQQEAEVYELRTRRKAGSWRKNCRRTGVSATASFTPLPATPTAQGFRAPSICRCPPFNPHPL